MYNLEPQEPSRNAMSFLQIPISGLPEHHVELIPGQLFVSFESTSQVDA